MEEERFTFDDATAIIEDFFGEENVDIKGENNYVLIRFPHVTITNEQDEFTEITNLFVKVRINHKGEMLGTFHMMRTEYTEAQVCSGYSHSHLPYLRFPIEFKEPCLGSGPIRRTVSLLNAMPSEDLWMLFCVELTKYVETESIAGVPYNYLRNIGRSSTNSYSSSFVNISSSILADKEVLYKFIDYLIIKRVLDFNYCNGYKIALEKNELIIKLSNLFIEWVNSLPEEKYDTYKSTIARFLVKGRYVNNKVEILSDYQRNINEFIQHTGEPLLTFKGKVYNFDITDINKEDDNFIFVLANNVLYKIVNILTAKVNYEYGCKEDCKTAETVRYFYN